MSAIAGQHYDTIIMDDLVKAEAPVKEQADQKKITEREYRKLMNQYFTVRRPIVEGCGHKIDTENGPKNNCQTCWFAYFNNHSELVQAIDQAMRTDGPEVVIALRGLKFVRMYRKFMSTVAQWIKEGKIAPSDHPANTQGS